MPSCNVLKFIDPSIGTEPHMAVIPPAPPTPMPYVQLTFLGHGILGKSKFSGPAKPVLTMNQFAMLQGTDCGYLSPHMGNMASVVYPMVLGFSSSKSMMVAGTVQMKGSPVAVAMLVVQNLNLNCASPVSLPLGIVPALTTVQAGMSAGDFMAGVCSAALQMALDFVVSKAPGLASAGVTKAFGINASRALSRAATGPMARAMMAYGGTNSLKSGVQMSREVFGALLGGARGIMLDQTNAENLSNSATSHYLGSNPNAVPDKDLSVFGSD